MARTYNAKKASSVEVGRNGKLYKEIGCSAGQGARKTAKKLATRIARYAKHEAITKGAEE